MKQRCTRHASRNSFGLLNLSVKYTFNLWSITHVIQNRSYIPGSMHHLWGSSLERTIYFFKMSIRCSSNSIWHLSAITSIIQKIFFQKFATSVYIHCLSLGHSKPPRFTLRRVHGQHVTKETSAKLQSASAGLRDTQKRQTWNHRPAGPRQLKSCSP